MATKIVWPIQPADLAINTDGIFMGRTKRNAIKVKQTFECSADYAIHSTIFALFKPVQWPVASALFPVSSTQYPENKSAKVDKRGPKIANSRIENESWPWGILRLIFVVVVQWRGMADQERVESLERKSLIS